MRLYTGSVHYLVKFTASDSYFFLFREENFKTFSQVPDYVLKDNAAKSGPQIKGNFYRKNNNIF